MYLRILELFGEYIGANQDKANPKTLKILKSVFLRLDEIVAENQMPETDLERDRFFGQSNILHKQE